MSSTPPPPPPPFPSGEAQPGERVVYVQSRANPPGRSFAITGMVLGIVGVFMFLLYGIIPILAIVFSALSLSQSKKAGTPRSGMAVAGLVLGIIFTLIAVVLFAAVLAGA